VQKPANTMATWGAWMGAWKAEAGLQDLEQERLSRQAAAFGSETSARVKDLNVLIVGCRGVGIETAKNLILCNVGSISVWDPAPACQEDLASNFYLSESGIGRPRATECLSQLRSLNPYCRVDVLDVQESALPTCLLEADVLQTGRRYSAVVVTQLLPRSVLFDLNTTARAQDIAFVLAVNLGVTASLFSDFGSRHCITDIDGEPVATYALSAVEVLEVDDILRVRDTVAGQKVIVLTLASDHALCHDDSIIFDDMRGQLEPLNGRVMTVRRFSFRSPKAASLDVKDAGFKELAKTRTSDLLANLKKQYEHHRSEWMPTKDGEPFPEREITLFNRLCLVIEPAVNEKHWASYTSGGLISTTKHTSATQHLSLEESLLGIVNPQMLDQELCLTGEGCWIHLALSAALAFRDHQDTWPRLHNTEDAQVLADLARKESDERRRVDEGCWLQKVEWGCPLSQPLDDDSMAAAISKIKRFSHIFCAELTGLCAFLGGAAAQEVIKKSGKFTPIDQWLHHDDPHLFSRGHTSLCSSYTLTRYAGQVAIIGEELMDELRRQRVFLVGCGALGCEYMKGLALIGACHKNSGGKLVVTDMDRIEVSNLSRQFLFKQTDVGCSKSSTAARVVASWNSDVCVMPLEKGVGPDSEDFFNDLFWSSLDVCWNALDNVAARKYTDKCCLWYGLPLLESGTLGTKCNSDVFLPGLTKSYSDSAENDTNETQIAMCTLRSFPYLPVHCIEYAKQAFFQDYMEFAPMQYEAFRKNPAAFFNQVDAMSTAEQFKVLRMVTEFVDLQQDGPIGFGSCITMAFRFFCKDFITSILDLVHTCNSIEVSTGRPFWTGTKRKPNPAVWGIRGHPAEAMEYLYTCANCFAYIWRVPYVRDRMQFEAMVEQMQLQPPSWKPPSDADVTSQTSGGEAPEEVIDSASVSEMHMRLRSIDTDALQQCQVHEFEKDDDSNFHIDFLTAATNLRAANYDIKLSERCDVKVTAGRIIPALATTTGMICGLVTLEFMKLVKSLHMSGNATSKFYNYNINLAIGLNAMNAFHPEAPCRHDSNLDALPNFTSWDKITVHGELTTRELVDHVQQQYGCIVQGIYDAQNEKICLYDGSGAFKLVWRIEFLEGKLVIEPQSVFDAWPQLRIARKMLEELPQGPARSNFEKQVLQCAEALKSAQHRFRDQMDRLVSDVYQEVSSVRSSSSCAQKANHARLYLALAIHVTKSSGEEAELPLVRYVLRPDHVASAVEGLPSSISNSTATTPASTTDRFPAAAPSDSKSTSPDSHRYDSPAIKKHSGEPGVKKRTTVRGESAGDTTALTPGSTQSSLPNGDALPETPQHPLTPPADVDTASVRQPNLAMISRAAGQRPRKGETTQDMLTRVTHLHLEDKGLTSLGDLLCSLCPRLRVLHLSENRLHELGPLRQTMEALNLQANNIWEMESWSSNLPNLEVLDLRENQIKHLSGLNRSFMLRELVLRGQRRLGLRFSMRTLRVISSSLRVLDVARNCLEDLSPLACLVHIQRFDASNNALATLDAASKAIGAMPGLSWLMLEGNPACKTTSRYREEVVLLVDRLQELDNRAVSDTERHFLRELNRRRRQRKRGPSAPPQLDRNSARQTPSPCPNVHGGNSHNSQSGNNGQSSRGLPGSRGSGGSGGCLAAAKASGRMGPRSASEGPRVLINQRPYTPETVGGGDPIGAGGGANSNVPFQRMRGCKRNSDNAINGDTQTRLPPLPPMGGTCEAAGFGRQFRQRGHDTLFG